MTYDFETERLVAALAFANTPRSLFQSLLRQDIVTQMARKFTPEQLVELARNATAGDEITIEDSAVAYAAIAALALKHFTPEVNEQASNVAGIRLPWAQSLAHLVREYGVPTVVADLTPPTFKQAALRKTTLLVNPGTEK